MTNWLITKNNIKVKIADIPSFEIEQLRENIIKEDKRPVGFFGQDYGELGTKLFVILADDEKGELLISSALFSKDEKQYNSLTKDVPSFHIFEREFYEEFGIEPIGHPWLKPVRKNQDKYEFFKMTGDEIHEVAVGPIHAGVIEPGHFRFMCNGEDVYHLEIMLGYQHKGVEKLMVKNYSNQLAESICGDSVIAYNKAYSQVIESLGDVKVSDKAQIIRNLALEMERAAIHIGDLGALSGDIAYLMGASVFGATRTLVINTMLEFCGSRFGRSFITVGGVNFDLDKDLINRAKKTFEKVEKDVKRLVQVMLGNTSVMSRLEKTGVVSMERAKEIGLVGMAARASGMNIDTRYDFPDKFMEKFDFNPRRYKYTGDVFSRFLLRYNEILDSFRLIGKYFDELENYADNTIKTDSDLKFEKDCFAVSLVEAWRGELVHIGITNSNGDLSRYKIKDPSFNNWYGLALAVRNNGVSDFPLCNKSFNLSYTGFDL